MQFNLADLFESLVDEIGSRTALVVDDQRWTWAELDERANRAAHFLTCQGIGPGDHIGLYLCNGNAFVELMLGAFKIRAVPININYRYVVEELAYLFENAQLKAVIHHQQFDEAVEKAVARVASVTCRIVVEDGSEVPSEALRYEEGLAGSGSGRDFPPRSGDDLYIVYTGGTTGMPRGVMWRQEDLLFAGLQGANPGGEPITSPGELLEMVRSGERWPMVIHPAPPLIHGGAQFASWIGLLTGGCVCYVSGPRFCPARSAALIDAEEVMVMQLIGDAMARPFAELEGEHSLESLAVITSAGAILSPAVRDRLQERLPETMILNNFGASETGHQGTAVVSDDPNQRATFEMLEGTAIFDEQFKRCAVGVVGKLARSGRIPLGYFGDEAKTKRTFVQAEGRRWVIPGDYAVQTEEGLITLLGRGAVCINSGGEKVYPEEVEEALKADPGVMDVLVVGLPDERWGERVAAVVQRRPGSDRSAGEMDQACRERVAGYKVPKDYFFVEQVSRHPSGKPDYAWARHVAAELAAVPQHG